jgi:hypothetical protein
MGLFEKRKPKEVLAEPEPSSLDAVSLERLYILRAEKQQERDGLIVKLKSEMKEINEAIDKKEAEGELTEMLNEMTEGRLDVLAKLLIEEEKEDG